MRVPVEPGQFFSSFIPTGRGRVFADKGELLPLCLPGHRRKCTAYPISYLVRTALSGNAWMKHAPTWFTVDENDINKTA